MCWGHTHEKDLLSIRVDAGFYPIGPSFQCQSVCGGYIIFFDGWRSISAVKKKSEGNKNLGA